MNEELREDEFEPEVSREVEPPESAGVAPDPDCKEIEERTGLFQGVYDGLPYELRLSIETSGAEVGFYRHFADWLIYEGLYESCISLLKNRFHLDEAAADDIFFEASDAVFAMLLNGRPVSYLPGLLRTSVWTRACSRHRKVKRRREEPLAQDVPDPRPPATAFERAEAVAEFRRRFGGAFRGMSASDRQIFILRCLRGYSNAKAAEWLAIDPKLAAVRYSRARQRFRRSWEFQ